MIYIKMQSNHTGRRVLENQEDDVAEVDIKKPHIHGFFVCGINRRSFFLQPI
jgi:hypothetical protein